MFFSKKRLLQQGSFSYVSNAFYVFVKRNERRSVAKKGKIRLSLFYVKTVNRYKNIIVKLFPSGNNVVFGLNKKLYIYPSLSLVIICLFTLIFYKHMNFLAEAFAKHILCLFFSTKAFMCYVLNFFEKKAFMCLFTAAWNAYFYFFIQQKPSCAYVFRQKPSCAMLNWPCAYKNECNPQTRIISLREIIFTIHI